MNEIIHWLDTFLTYIGVSKEFVDKADRFLAVILSLVVALLLTKAAKKWLVPVLYRILQHSKTKWDDFFLSERVLRAACNLIPPIFLLYAVPSISVEHTIPHKIEIACLIYLTIVFLFLFNTMVDAIYDWWNSHENLREKPIMGYLQGLKIVFYIIATIIIIAILLDRSPAMLLTGLGASAAILSLVFKDTIMGLVASIQLSANDMLRKGDWITIPKHDINGVVEEISLNTVKIKNFDTTTLTIPPHLLISDSFQNWRTMKEGGARRVMKSILIDIQTVRFYTLEEAQSLPGYEFIAEEATALIERGQVVNLSLLRLYLHWYLQQHKFVSTEKFCTVRELQHTPEGIPLELVFFITEIEWGTFEGVQAHIFDHATAAVPLFGLRIYQHPSGRDMTYVGDTLAAQLLPLKRKES